MNILMTFILQRNIKVYWLFQHWMGRYTDDFLDPLDVLQFNLARFIPLTVTVIKEDSLQLYTLVSFGHLSSIHSAFLPIFAPACSATWGMSFSGGKRNNSKLEGSTPSLGSLVLSQPSPDAIFPYFSPWSALYSVDFGVQERFCSQEDILPLGSTIQLISC